MPILPTLTAWASSHLTGILEAKTQEQFDTAFDETFATDAVFVFNGQSLSRDEYKAQLLEQSADAPLEAGTAVTIQGATEVETGDQGQLSGIVGLFYTAISDSKFLILGAPAESRATSSINLTIEPTEKDPHPTKPPIRGYFDPRRVVSVNQVAAENTFHVTLPKSALPKTTGDKALKKIELGPGPVQLPQDYDKKYRWLLGGGVKVVPSTGFGGLLEPGPVIIPGETVGGSKA